MGIHLPGKNHSLIARLSCLVLHVVLGPCNTVLDRAQCLPSMECSEFPIPSIKGSH